MAAGADGPARRASGALAARVFDRVIDAGAALAALLLVVIMLATTVKVVFRYGLHQSLIGVDQISGTLLLYVAFLGAAWVLRRDEHVIIDLLLGQVGSRTRRYLLLASALIGAAVCLVLAAFGTWEVITSLQRGIRIPAEIEMPRAVNLVVIPLGFLLLGLQFLRRAVRLRRNDAPPSPLISV
ncbi:MAG: TRAP transporter small permease [Burkholderiales bacterium]|nr:TRAP transporter small permease [Burkholderiales bacterium]